MLYPKFHGSNHFHCPFPDRRAKETKRPFPTVLTRTNSCFMHTLRSKRLYFVFLLWARGQTSWRRGPFGTQSCNCLPGLIACPVDVLYVGPIVHADHLHKKDYVLQVGSSSHEVRQSIGRPLHQAIASQGICKARRKGQVPRQARLYVALKTRLKTGAKQTVLHTRKHWLAKAIRLHVTRNDSRSKQ